MKFKLYLTFIILWTAHPLYSCLGCMDNHSHLSDEYDTKCYRRIIGCECACKYRIDDRDQCLDCGHYHEPKPLIFIKELPPHKAAQSNRHHDPARIMTQLAKKYQQNSAHLAKSSKK